MAKSGHAGKSPSMISTIMLVLGLLMATLGTTGLSLSLSLSVIHDFKVFYSPNQMLLCLNPRLRSCDIVTHPQCTAWPLAPTCGFHVVVRGSGCMEQ